MIQSVEELKAILGEARSVRSDDWRQRILNTFGALLEAARALESVAEIDLARFRMSNNLHDEEDEMLVEKDIAEITENVLSRIPAKLLEEESCQ